MNQLLFWVAAAVLLNVAAKLLNKYVLKAHDAHPAAVYLNAVGALIFLAVALPHLTWPREPMAWAALALSSAVWSLVALSSFISYKAADLSLRDPLAQTKIVFAFALGVLLLGEHPSVSRTIGAGLTFLGAAVMVYRRGKKLWDWEAPDIRWTLVSALLGGVVAITDKFALRYFESSTYGFLVYFVPTFLLLAFLKERRHSLTHLLKNHWLPATLAAVLSAGGYFCTLQAYKFGEVTLVYPLLQLGLPLTVLAGVVILKERRDLGRKAVAVALMLVAAALLKR